MTGVFASAKAKKLMHCLDSGGNTGSATFTLTIAPPDALAGH
ncbi:MAG: hypothetical protein SF123_04600 [Chloroflexota bacterium]|nr:hypothetical protein [Chloroflexota bacterium]